MHAPLLIELLTEELPPKALRRLRDAFASALRDGLSQHGLITADSEVHALATPRRLAVRIGTVAAHGAERPNALKGPAVAVGVP